MKAFVAAAARVGAALGPAAIRSALYRLAPDARSPRFDELLSRTRDAGDVAVSGDVEMDQQRLGEVLKSYIELGCFCVVLGGGHETSYRHFLGYTRAGRSGRADGAPRLCDGVVAVARQVGAALDRTTCALFGSDAL